MSGVAARAVSESPIAPVADVVSHVFDDGGVLDALAPDEHAARLARLIEPRFLAESGWDPTGQILAPPSDHPQLGWDEPIGRVPAQVSGTTAAERGRVRGVGLLAAGGIAWTVPVTSAGPTAPRDVGGRVRRRPGTPCSGPVR
jgi:hypothetical protein